MIGLVCSLVVLSVLVNLASFIWSLYDLVWWYDKAVHAFTNFAFTLPLPLFLYDRAFKGLRQHPILLLVVITSLGLALGAGWEIIEWGGSEIWGGPNLKEGRRDVITDLIVDGLGALVGASAGMVILQRRRSSDTSANKSQR
jgi:glycopeptide antibiotics resistance protein